jgi:hypothetical protein
VNSRFVEIRIVSSHALQDFSWACRGAPTTKHSGPNLFSNNRIDRNGYDQFAEWEKLLGIPVRTKWLHFSSCLR